MHRYYALELRGNQQYVEIPSSPRLNVRNEFTISAWIRTTDFGVPILDRKVYRLGLKVVWKRGYLELCVASKCFLGTHPIVLGSWYHVVAIFRHDEDGTGGFVKFVVNGVEDQTSETPDFAPQAEDYAGDIPLFIGANYARTSFFKGTIDDVSPRTVLLHADSTRYHCGTLQFQQIMRSSWCLMCHQALKMVSLVTGGSIMIKVK